jgi:hypothetical protein
LSYDVTYYSLLCKLTHITFSDFNLTAEATLTASILGEPQSLQFADYPDYVSFNYLNQDGFTKCGPRNYTALYKGQPIDYLTVTQDRVMTLTPLKSDELGLKYVTLFV